MNLTTFSKDTLINMIEDQQKLIQEQNKLISEYVSNKPMTKPGTYEIYNEDTKEMDTIDKNIVFNYGSGQLRYKKGDTYYHGIGSMEDKFAWYRNWPNHTYDRGILEYRSKGHVLAHIEWCTHDAQEFCSHCKCNIEETNKKRVYNQFHCLGHTM